MIVTGGLGISVGALALRGLGVEALPPDGGSQIGTSSRGSGTSRWFSRAKVGEDISDILKEYAVEDADESDILDIVTIFTLSNDRRR